MANSTNPILRFLDPNYQFVESNVKLAPLTPLAPLSQHTYHPAMLSTGSGGGTGDQGSGGDPNYTGGGGPTYTGPPQVGQCLPGDYTCLAGCDPSQDPSCNVIGSSPSKPSITGYTSSGCSLFDPNSWATSCILRALMLILGLIAIAGGIWMLKPALVEKPLKAVTKAAALAA